MEMEAPFDGLLQVLMFYRLGKTKKNLRGGWQPPPPPPPPPFVRPRVKRLSKRKNGSQGDKSVIKMLMKLNEAKKCLNMIRELRKDGYTG